MREKVNNKCEGCGMKFPTIPTSYTIVLRLGLTKKTISEFNCSKCFIQHLNLTSSSDIRSITRKMGGKETVCQFGPDTRKVDVVKYFGLK